MYGAEEGDGAAAGAMLRPAGEGVAMGPARKRRVLLCGYYGEHNLGDDALLRVLLQQLPAGWEPVATARDEVLVRERFGVETTDRRSLRGVLATLGGCEALVLGGGSLLQDSTSFRSLLYYGALMMAARLAGRPVLLWGQGLGPLRRRRSRWLARGLLPLASAISWRDGASAEQARRWGVDGLLGSDPVWALPPVPWRGSGGPLVICWRPVASLREEGWRGLLKAVETVAAAADREVLWLPFHQEQDAGLLADLRDRGLLGPNLLARSRPATAADPAEALEIFSRAGLVVAMRLHGLILAALAGSPCAALSYDPKVSAAAGGIGCPCADLASPPAEGLARLWKECLDHPPDPERLRRERERAAVHARVLESLPGS